jgi:transposase
MCEAFRNFVKNNFINAKLTIDKFHVLRLISRPFSRCRREKIGHLKSNPQSRILFKREETLELEQKVQIAEMINLKGNENLKKYYNVYQSLHRFYGTRGYKRGKKKLEKIIATASESKLKPIVTLSETLTKWKEEILNYFSTKLTNAKTEGFNRLAKLLQRRSFGFKNLGWGPNFGRGDTI